MKALLSVCDKTNLPPLARALADAGLDGMQVGEITAAEGAERVII